MSVRGDTAFAIPELYKLLEAEGFQHTIRLKTNAVLERGIRLHTHERVET